MCAKNFINEKKFYLYLLLVAYFYLLFCCICNATSSNATSTITHNSLNTHHHYECGSIDIRNECSNFEILRNCTVVKGFLMIVLLPRDKYLDNGLDTCDYDKIHFPQLREITDYFLMYQVKGLKRIREMFPKLTVIRGRRLILNYAVGITEMPDLEAIEFSSLIAIQRGHVFIGSSPKLCQLEKINWDRLTLTAGQNHIFPDSSQKCNEKSICRGCDTPYCWSNNVCQKFENDNVLNFRQSTKHCHAECLGGCTNGTNAGCAVCRGLTDHGVCVKECPLDKYMHEHSQRCYTHEECTVRMQLLAHDGLCISQCPSGYRRDNHGSCTPCNSNETCVTICPSDKNNEGLTIINTLSDADRLANCEVINGTFIISIRNKINEKDLAEKLRGIREIKGYLKVSRSPHLTSLKFLNNLKKIDGIPAENGHYSVIIYDNKKLKELWTPHFEMERGGMFIHLNNRLCNHIIMEFRENVKHDRSLDSLQTSDEEVLCGPLKLVLDVQVLSHRKLLFSWHKAETAEKIEILYRPVSENEEFFHDESELDTPVCERIIWHRELVFKNELIENGTHYSYKADGLLQNTKYACMVKTFGSKYIQNARSDIEFMKTKEDIPLPPIINIIKKTDSSMTFNLTVYNTTSQYSIDYYLLELYKKPDDVNFLDKRNYCLKPAYLTKDLLTEIYSKSVYDDDYDDCCARVEDDNEDERFIMNMRTEFGCSLDAKENCLIDKKLQSDEEKPILNLRLSKNESTYELHYLERFQLYVLMVKACNEIGCSSFAIHSERTNFTASGDLVGELSGCHVANSNEYRVYFTEPKQPNGVIVSYMVHFQQYISNADDHYRSHIGCVTRLDHQKSNYIFVRHINSTFNQVAVRAHSLAGDAITHWINITACENDRSMPTKLADFHKNSSNVVVHAGHNINIFLIFFILGCIGTALWVFYKQRCWRRLPKLRRTREAVRSWMLRDENTVIEDRQILVDNFETVHFHNRQVDEDDNDAATYSMLIN